MLGHANFTLWEDRVPMNTGNALASWLIRKDSPYQSMQDVIDDAKANPGKVSISTSGTGGVWHELALIVANIAWIELIYVPYKGANLQLWKGYKAKLTSQAGEFMNTSIWLTPARCAISARPA